MKDRIQISTLCVFLSSLGFFSTGWSMYGAVGNTQFLGALFCAYAVIVYLGMAVLAIEMKHWAWVVCNVALGVHLAAAVPIAMSASRGSWKECLVFLVWAAVGGIGLWANLRPGSRAATQRKRRIAA